MVPEPEVFLLDEPLSNLDAKLREDMRHKRVSLDKRPGTTMIYVTYDQVEAMTMEEQIIVMNQGEVIQVGPPLEIYSHPANTFVSGFISTPAIVFWRRTIPSTSAPAHSPDRAPRLPWKKRHCGHSTGRGAAAHTSSDTPPG